MIPATVPCLATFRDEHGISEQLPVIAWNDDGEALVVGNQGNLVRASDLPGFVCVTHHHTAAAVAAVPGGGWHVQWKDDNERMPVAIWVLTAGGEARPYVSDSTGGPLMNASLYSEEYDVIPPGEAPE